MNDIDNIDILKGVGAKSASLFLKCKVNNIKDLGEYFPRNYLAFDEPVCFNDLKPSNRAAVKVKVHSRMIIRPARRYKLCVVTVMDSEGELREIVWFNMPFLANLFHLNETFILVGNPVKGANNKLTFKHPAYYKEEEYSKLANSLQPVYPLVEGLSNKLVTKAVKQLKGYFEAKKEYLNDDYIKEQDMLALADAFWQMHFPTDLELLIKARKRMVYHEFFKFLLAMDELKENNTRSKNNFIIKEDERIHTFITNLPYDLTMAQKECFEEILSDLTGDYSMNRLVQGDVGSGKTIVAALALLTVILNGYQGAMMAPTEVLASQHYKKLKALFEPLGIKIALLTGSVKGKDKKALKEAIAKHEVDLIIGTHAIIVDSVDYNNLALVVTDEQHRFGVKQREKLAKKGDTPHVLVMSATPIPRTLAMMLYSDMDISIMKEKPANRLPIKNCVVGTNYRNAAYKFMNDEINKGHQCYVICPMVEESDRTDAENVIDYADNLKAHLPNARINYLHGKLKEDEKATILNSFSRGELDIIVSTTVIEVGIDVPNATFMMIENAESFGLASLHQLRGRVGRGDAQSYCVFIYGKENDHIKERLSVLNDSNDGFEIAMKDLELRGPGDFFGIRQSGIMNFKLADIFQDGKILVEANNHLKAMKAEGFDYTKYKELSLPKDMELSI
ncbi:MAG: ATP-dependent DNA helicase RecG [Lachnospiraceae bacterium]|nr:ATP-dependent DNA helicase RecG [Lachnospiraceae bacterium]